MFVFSLEMLLLFSYFSEKQKNFILLMEKSTQIQPCVKPKFQIGVNTTLGDLKENYLMNNKQKVGRWQICENLGVGGYSWYGTKKRKKKKDHYFEHNFFFRVKKGRDIESKWIVALKFTKREIQKNGEWSDRVLFYIFFVQIAALTQVKHPHVIRLLAYNLKTNCLGLKNEKEDVVLLVLEYMPNGDLFDLLYKTACLDETITRTYFRQLIEGLEACHQAMIVHRDIKPQNLLLDKNYCLKVAFFFFFFFFSFPFFFLSISDFGLAKIVTSDNDAIMGTFHVGTKGYQSPEVLMKQPYTANCDIFSAGVVLFILLTGRYCDFCICCFFFFKKKKRVREMNNSNNQKNKQTNAHNSKVVRSRMPRSQTSSTDTLSKGSTSSFGWPIGYQSLALVPWT
ncbi:hypothetical protein RFI_30848 [Reticulomyxa filosa]|uniref:Protein kinase domain-containing protein n=1 Tax=Reticulomyxa filosa TaxID=46433 RepID=X6M0P1_RETFI|nr:hypothetical protein RFI_30848 [Reticulomyxa filosa]|eukprot:ETO06545.1 hypothetical protein RFI_30848 [Reticulomyxa filosa]